MRKILILWAATIIFFWGWYFLSYYDLSGGFFFFSRGFHDHMFTIYGNVLQMPASEVPEKLAWVFVFDTFIVLGIAALRWYKHWLPQTWSWIKSRFVSANDRVLVEPKSSVSGPMHPAE